MMKGLLLKDYYTLLKQMKIFLLMIIVFSMMPNLSLACFAVVYAAMLPITVLGYDERAKWDSLAVMMPYSTRNIVLSKYVLGYIAIAGAAVISMGAQLVIGAVQHNTAPAGENLLVVGAASGLALLFIALNLPLMFRLGVENGRVAFFITFAVGV
ncbi:MAG: ABC-2 transporter permease, partial [Syntrophomonadaceae bacterium]|nr:ABC-2 transporter permease [Syntrophomonadaceae bacterium]